MYLTPGPKEAAQKYKGKGQIMHVQKVGRERLLPKGGLLPEIGGFLTLGDKILQDLNKGGTLVEQVEVNKEKRRHRLFTKNLKRGLNAE